MLPLNGTRSRKPRILAVSGASILLSLICGLELWLVRHLHLAERSFVATDAALLQLPPRSIGTSDTITDRPGSPARLTARVIPPPPKAQATSKHVKKPPPPSYPPSAFTNCTILRPNDSIYQYGPWDAAPIVMERHQLLLFTVPKVGCTLLKQLCRRMMHYEDWRDDQHPLPHAPRRNGLAYLYDYPPAEADRMLTAPDWTRAMFVREPLERLLSAYLDKGVQNQYMQFHCCRGLTGPPGDGRNDKAEEDDDKDDDDDDDEIGADKAKASNATVTHHLYELLQCSKQQAHKGPLESEQESKQSKQQPLLTFVDFLRLIQQHPSEHCRNDPHWKPLAQRLDLKYWTTPGIINFVGHMEHMADDTRRLLQRIGAWEDYGAHGWPPKDGAIFAGPVTVHHATDSGSKLSDYYATNDASVPDSPLAMALRLSRRDFDLIPGLVKPNASLKML